MLANRSATLGCAFFSFLESIRLNPSIMSHVNAPAGHEATMGAIDEPSSLDEGDEEGEKCLVGGSGDAENSDEELIQIGLPGTPLEVDMGCAWRRRLNRRSVSSSSSFTRRLRGTAIRSSDRFTASESVSVSVLLGI